MFNWFKEEEKKIVDNSTSSDAISKAVEALNALTEHYQAIESNNNTPITIELKSPWQETQMFGGSDKGILGVIVLKATSNKLSLQDHPFIKTLNTMNIRVGSNFSDNNSFCGTYTLYHLPSIENIPTKCGKIIDKAVEQSQRIQF